MAKEGYPTKLLIKLFDEAVIKKVGEAGKEGIKKYQNKIWEDRLPFGDRYMSNIYQKFLNSPSELFNLSRTCLDFMSKEAGHRDFRDFLQQNGCVDEKIKKAPQSKGLENLLKGNPPPIQEWIDKYVIGARVMPTFLGIFPFLVTLFFVALEYNGESGGSILAFALFIGFGLVFGLSGWLATFGKRWESRLFFENGKKGFPTTYLMLFGVRSKFSATQKLEYRDKVSAYFGIQFPSKEEEQANDVETIQKLNEAGAKVKNVVKSVVIRSALTRYGFHRNLIPASALAMTLSVPGIAYGFWKVGPPLIVCTVLCFAASLYYYIYHYKWVKTASEAYARYLIDEFLSR